MNKWEILWNHRDMIAGGFVNTLVLFGVSVVAAFLLGALVTLAIQTGRGLSGTAVRGAVDGLRMLPFLIYVYILYYGLPSLGIRFDAWTAGFIALITYHAAYFAEILRGAWATLSTGQAESARASGFTRLGMYWSIVLL